MPVPATMPLIYLGNLTEVDTDEYDWDAENPNAILGTYSAFDTLLPVTVTNHDTNSDGTISDDENDEMGGTASDYVSYTLDGVTYTPQVDNSAVYSAQVTERDGTVETFNVVVFQMANGDTFVGDLGGNLDNREVREIQLLSEVASAYSGFSNNFSIANTAVCFCEGTRIRTICGYVPIEDLKPGATLKTIDNGYKLLIWIGGCYLARANKQAPVHIAKGALGRDLPHRALAVSPQHRLLVCSKVAQRMFGQPEVLIPAFRLVGLPGITRGPSDAPVTYWHILCDAHEIVDAEGALTETLFPGDMAQVIARQMWDADLKDMMGAPKHIEPARYIPAPQQQKRLIARLYQNQKAVLDRV